MIVVGLVVCLSGYNVRVEAQELKNTITFENQSGEYVLVKLVGPTAQSLEVPNGETRTVNVAAGEYSILARYGSTPDQYTYTKGDPFMVTKTTTQYSAMTITLHKVVGGNYPAHPTSQEEFDKIVTSSGQIKGILMDYDSKRHLPATKLKLFALKGVPDKDGWAPIDDLNIQVTTSESGDFIFDKVAPGKYMIMVQFQKGN